MGFSDSQIDDLRERADIAALIGKRVQLKKSGANFMGLCPFHGERSPSFSVVPSRHFFNCFGCGEKGDVFKFFMKLDGMPFVEAVKHVAQEMGVVLVDEQHDPEEARRRHHLDELAQLVERSVKFYEQKLWHEQGRAVREYVVRRGVTEESIRRFKLGFGGYGRDDLARALEKAQVPEALAVEAGLCIASTRGGRAFDRFHGRLIIPIRLPRPPDGRSIALGGRFLEGITPERGDGRKAAKYINSPETPLYQKGHVLFGLHEARDAIRKEERAVIVEGYFDVLGVHQAGVPLAVATCGTSLTQAHLELLLRTGAKEIVFLFDGDEAGVKAASRAAELCAKGQVPAKVAMLPDGLDPDDFARDRGEAGLRALFDRARPAIEVLIDAALSAPGPEATVEEKVRAVLAVRDVVMSAPEGLSRELYVSQIAERLGVSESAVKSTLYDPPSARSRAPSGGADRPGPRAAGGRRRPDGPVRNAPRPDSAEDEESVPAYREPPRPRRGAAPTSEDTARAVLARRTFSAEEGITIALLRHPVLAPTVEQEGVVAHFANPALKALAERVLARLHEGEAVESVELLLTVEDVELRRDLARKLQLDDTTLQQSAEHLGRVLDRLRIELGKAAGLQQARSVSPDVPTSADAEAERAKAEELQRALEERRELRRRQEERRRGGG